MTWEIVSLWAEDDPEATPVAMVEAPGKIAALNGAAKGLGGHVSHLKLYQQNRAVLHLDDGQYIARKPLPDENPC